MLFIKYFTCKGLFPQIKLLDCIFTLVQLINKNARGCGAVQHLHSYGNLGSVIIPTIVQETKILKKALQKMERWKLRRKSGMMLGAPSVCSIHTMLSSLCVVHMTKVVDHTCMTNQNKTAETMLLKVLNHWAWDHYRNSMTIQGWVGQEGEQ